MFQFEKLDVYQKALNLNKQIFCFLKRHQEIDKYLQLQLKRATSSIALNLAEGQSRFTVPDRRHFCVMSRSSAFEVVACLQIIFNQYQISNDYYKEFEADIEEISKMLFALIRRKVINKA